MTTQAKVYVARWQESGGGGYAQADTLDKLRVVVTGRPYAPTWANVYVTELQNGVDNIPNQRYM